MIAKKYAEELIDSQNILFENKTLKLIVSERNIIKGLIDDFSEKPLTLTYVNDELRQQMIHDKANNPFNIYYIVSGELVKAEKNSKIIAYRVLEIIDTIIE